MKIVEPLINIIMITDETMNGLRELYAAIRTSRMTKEAFEQHAAELKDAVKREENKTFDALYTDMTIRKAVDLWHGVSGYPDFRSYLQEIGYRYDVDSPEDFEKWAGSFESRMDIYEVDCYLRPIPARLKDGTEGWIFRLGGINGYSVILAEYCLALQKAGAIFYLDGPRQVMKELGYWIRSWRREYKKEC